jgi:group I intron endonuclease
MYYVLNESVPLQVTSSRNTKRDSVTGRMARALKQNHYSSGIYSIRNTVTQRTYIGASVKVGFRHWEHRTRLRQGIHKNLTLQIDYNQYGPNAFVFTVLEWAGRNQLTEREQHWMNITSSNRTGYNHGDAYSSQRGNRWSKYQSLGG